MSFPHFDLMVSISFLHWFAAAQLFFAKKKAARSFLLSLHLKKVRTVSQGTSDGPGLQNFERSQGALTSVLECE